jgi:hypothetical protein
MEHPVLAPHVKMLRRQRKREMTIHTLQASAAAVADKGPSVMGAISSVASVLHGI